MINIVSTVTGDAIFNGANGIEILIKGKKDGLFAVQNIIEAKHLAFLKSNESFLRSLQYGFYRIEQKELTESERQKMENMDDASSQLQVVGTSDGIAFQKPAKNEEPKELKKTIKKSVAQDDEEEDEDKLAIGFDFEVIETNGDKTIIEKNGVQLVINANEIKNGILGKKASSKLLKAVAEATSKDKA